MHLICGDSTNWNGSADLVCTNPYGQIPACLRGKPAIVSLVDAKNRQRIAEEWICARLTKIGTWSRNNVFVANLEARNVEIGDLVEDEYMPHVGWFPLELPLRLLREYGRTGMTVWDGFMGRGTVGKACQILGMSFIGIDIDPKRVALAREYIAQDSLRAQALC